jgi:hypothetical protein
MARGSGPRCLGAAWCLEHADAVLQEFALEAEAGKLSFDLAPMRGTETPCCEVAQSLVLLLHRDRRGVCLVHGDRGSHCLRLWPVQKGGLLVMSDRKLVTVTGCPGFEKRVYRE